MSEPHTGERADLEIPPTVASPDDATGGPDTDLVGRVLGGRYRIIRKLGEGAMGAVYLGEHLKIGRHDAIKVLRRSLATDPDTIARFVRGTRNVSMIRHPNICTIYDFSDLAGDVQFVAMEYVPGETLRELLEREGRLPLDMSLQIARQAADALQAAHEVGIVHRDLKPANIMVVRGRAGAVEVKVVDFDIAKGPKDGEGEEVTRMGFVVGTPEYMSPEQLIGDRLDGRSDVYSLALVLFRMLTGTLPFRAEDTQDLMVKRLTEEPLALTDAFPAGDFPPQLEAAIRRALERKPADRQASARDFAKEIESGVGQVAIAGNAASPTADTAVRAQSADATHRGEAPRRTTQYGLMGGALVVTGTVIAVAIWALGNGDSELESATTPGVDEAGVVEYVDPLTSVASTASAATSEASSPPASVEPANAQPANPPAPETSPATQPPPSAPRSPTMDELFVLLDRVGPPYPAEATLLGVRDTAVLAWSDPGSPAEQRALAAYVAASALIPLSETAEAIQWAERSVQLRPDYAPYRDLLESLRRLDGGN